MLVKGNMDAPKRGTDAKILVLWPQTQETPEAVKPRGYLKLTRCSELGLANLDDVLVVAKKGDTNTNGVGSDQSSTATEAQHDRKS